LAAVESQARHDVSSGARRGVRDIDGLYIKYALERGYTPFELSAWTKEAMAELRSKRRAA
jgi:hypothetical protein